MGCMTAVGSSMFGHPVWPWAYKDFVHVVDCGEWVCNWLAQVDFDPIGVTEGSCVMEFVRHVMAGIEVSW